MSEEGITSKILKLLESEEKSAADREAKLKVIQTLIDYLYDKKSAQYMQGFKDGYKQGFSEGYAQAQLGVLE
ncbi:MAG: hypothetical protein QW429_03895 [Thermoprotei archaeon]